MEPSRHQSLPRALIWVAVTGCCWTTILHFLCSLMSDDAASVIAKKLRINKLRTTYFKIAAHPTAKMTAKARGPDTPVQSAIST